MKEHVIINLDRTVNVPESMKKIGIQYDHNVKTITFDCPRYPDENPNVDMSTMKIFINWMLPDKTLGSTIATNVCVDSKNENLMHFDWVITRVVTSVSGVLSTLICIKETTEAGEETYHWNTELIQSFKVGNGMECAEQIAEQNIDVITQLLVQMDAVDARTSTEAMQGYVDTSVNTYLNQNPITPTDEQATTGINTYMNNHAQTEINTYMNKHAQTEIDAYMTENAQGCVNNYLTEHPISPTEEQMKQGVAANSEMFQSSVDDYLGRNPLQLDNGLTETTKAAPANKVGEIQSDVTELKGDLVELNNFVYTGLCNNFDEWVNGTFEYIDVGHTLSAYDYTPFDKTRKRTDLFKYVKGALKIVAKDGYMFCVLSISEDNRILESSGYVTTFSGTPNKYAIVVKEENNADISNIYIDDMIVIEESAELIYKVNGIVENFENGLVVDNDKQIGDSVIWKQNKVLSVNNNSIYELDGFKYFEYLDISNFDKISITMIISSVSDSSLGIAFYDENYSLVEYYMPTIGASGVEVRTINVPERAKYIRGNYRISDSYGEFSLIGFTNLNVKNSINEINSKIGDLLLQSNELNLHKQAINNGTLNAIKRARQLTDFVWTPLTDITRVCLSTSDVYSHNNIPFEDVFKSEIEYKGIPYSASADSRIVEYGYTDAYVGNYISFDAFVSSVRNPNSGLATLSRYSPTQKYSGGASLYGSICNALVCYALDIPNMDCNELATTPLFKKINDVYSNGTYINFNLIELGDVLLEATHVLLITDIIKCDNEVVGIELSEAAKTGNGNPNCSKNNLGGGGKWGGVCRRKVWSIEEFKRYYSEYSVYRYKYISQVEYHKNSNIPVGSEHDSFIIENLPCIPFMGDKFVYIKNKIPNKTVLTPCNAWSYLVVKKDGVNFNNPYPITGDSVNVGFSDVGFYEAHLANIENGVETSKSRSCYWYVADCSVITQSNGNDITFHCTFNDATNNIKAVRFSDSEWSMSGDIYFPSNVQIVNNNDGTFTYTFTITKQSNQNKFRLEINGKYGNWHTDFMSV